MSKWIETNLPILELAGSMVLMALLAFWVAIHLP